MNHLKLTASLAVILLSGSALAATATPLSPEFVSLFDGKTMSALRPVGSAKWAVASGQIVATDGRGWLAMKQRWQDGRGKVRVRCDGDCDTGLLIRGRAADGGTEGIYLSLNSKDAGAVSVVTVDDNGQILSKRNPDHAPPGPRPSFTQDMSVQTPGAPPAAAPTFPGGGGGRGAQ